MMEYIFMRVNIRFLIMFLKFYKAIILLNLHINS